MTTKTQHTAGPWKIYGSNNVSKAREFVIQFSDGELKSTICKMYESTLCEEHGNLEANARLIAAAPDLLKACQYALQQLEGVKKLSGVHSSSLRADIEIIKSAILKATGGQS